MVDAIEAAAGHPRPLLWRVVQVVRMPRAISVISSRRRDYSSLNVTLRASERGSSFGTV
jgi:hypothetical protein